MRGYPPNSKTASTIATATAVTNGVSLADNAITAAKIGADAIGASEIADGAIDAGALAADCVTAAKIASDAIGKIWAALLTSITTEGSIGKQIKDTLDAAISTRATPNDVTVIVGD